MTGSELLVYIHKLKQYRLNYEPDWYRNFYAYENNCFVTWSRTTQSVIKMPYRKRFFNQLPEIKKQADNFENLLLNYKPLFVVYPPDISNKKDRDEASAISKRLRSRYDDWDANRLTHEYVHLAIKYPVSFWSIGVQKKFDPVAGRVKNTIVPSVDDVFDWLFDPRLPFQDNPIVVKIIRRPKKDLMSEYGMKEPQSSELSVATDYKEMIYDVKYGVRQEVGEYATYIVYQVFEKTKTGIDETIIDNSGAILKKNSFEGATFYPVVPLQLSSGDIYQPSYVSNLTPISRSISLIVNRIEEFIMRFAKGSYLLRDGSDAWFTDENGVIMKYEGEKPDVMQIPQLPPAVGEWLRSLMSFSERYGINQIAGGGTPKGSNIRAGKMMEDAVKNQQLQHKTALDNLLQAFKLIAELTIY
jgi:hypothetical protein